MTVRQLFVMFQTKQIQTLLNIKIAAYRYLTSLTVISMFWFAYSDGIAAPVSDKYSRSKLPEAKVILQASAQSLTATQRPEHPVDLTPQFNFEVRTPVIGNVIGDVVKILTEVTASRSQLSVQMTPIDTQHGFVYTAHIEPGPNGDSNDTTLRTVLRKGVQHGDGHWSWTSKLIEDRTMQNKWHAAPSVAVDQEGYVHVAYNMHNMPWQYQRSNNPHDISSLNFLGQSVSQAELDRLALQNKTHFPDLGTAEIPGNQISYPRFQKNRSGELYVSYRFSAKPNQRFADRMMSTGVARYNTRDNRWTSIGAQIPMNSSDHQARDGAPDRPTVFAGQPGWTSYLPRLMFGAADELNINLFWRSGTAGAKLSRACHFKSPDGESFFDSKGQFISLPIQPADCSNIIFDDNQELHTIGTATMDSHGTPYLLLSPTGMPRQIAWFDANTQSWKKEPSPSSATEIFFDDDDNLWAIGKGITIYKRDKASANWETIFAEGDSRNCYPKAKLNEDASIAYIHTQACNLSSVTVYALRLK